METAPAFRLYRPEHGVSQPAFTGAAAMPDPRLICALDLPTADEARAMVDRLGDSVAFYKVGLQLFATEGMALA